MACRLALLEHYADMACRAAALHAAQNGAAAACVLDRAAPGIALAVEWAIEVLNIMGMSCMLAALYFGRKCVQKPPPPPPPTPPTPASTAAGLPPAKSTSREKR